MIEFLALAEPELQFAGADFSSVAIDVCRERRPEFDWIVHDLTVGPIPGSFDAVICSEVLEHLAEPRPAVRHLAAAVKPGGFLILTVPHGKVFPTEREFGHVAHPEIGELESWGADAGLRTISSRAWGYPAYALLKRLANVRPDVALDRLGYGTYGPAAKAINNVAYWATLVGSLPHSRRGVQTVHLSKRPENVA
jgi:SAM-dependent methyltransferase